MFPAFYKFSMFFPSFSRCFLIFPVPSPRFYLTGHSLGGGLAKLVALEVGRKSATGASGFSGNPWANHGTSPLNGSFDE